MREYFEYFWLSLPRSRDLPGKFTVYWSFLNAEGRTCLRSYLIDANKADQAIDTAYTLMPAYAKSRLTGLIKAIPARSDHHQF